MVVEGIAGRRRATYGLERTEKADRQNCFKWQLARVVTEDPAAMAAPKVGGGEAGVGESMRNK